MIQVYRNLHKKCWSIREKGKRIQHAHSLIMDDCTFEKIRWRHPYFIFGDTVYTQAAFKEDAASKEITLIETMTYEDFEDKRDLHLASEGLQIFSDIFDSEVYILDIDQVIWTFFASAVSTSFYRGRFSGIIPGQIKIC